MSLMARQKKSVYGAKRRKNGYNGAKIRKKIRKWLKKPLTTQPFMALMVRSAKKKCLWREAPKKRL